MWIITPTSQSCPQPGCLLVTGTWCCSGMLLCPRPAAGQISVCNSQTTCLQGMTNLILWALAWKLRVYPWHPSTQTAKGKSSSSTVNLKWISLGRSLLVSSIWILQCFQPSCPFFNHIYCSQAQQHHEFALSCFLKAVKTNMSFPSISTQEKLRDLSCF